MLFVDRRFLVSFKKDRGVLFARLRERACRTLDLRFIGPMARSEVRLGNLRKLRA